MTLGTYSRPWISTYPDLLTYRDLLDRLIRYADANVADAQRVQYQIAVDEGYRKFINERAWNYYNSQWIIDFNAPQTTGTIQYTNSTRTVALTGATWPSWAAGGHIVIDTAYYEIDTVVDSTTLKLNPQTLPGLDYDAGTSYTLYQSSYNLPADFRAMWSPENQNAFWPTKFITPAEFYKLERQLRVGGLPIFWTIVPNPKLYNTFQVAMWPWPQQTNTVGVLYQRTGRPMRITGYGSVETVGTVAASSSGATVTGTNTTFNQGMVGAVFRFGDTTNVPDGWTGTYPFAEQRTIIAVTDATHLTLDAAPAGTYSGNKYCISDPVDCPPPFINGLLAACRWVYARNNPQSSEAVALAEAVYRTELTKACEDASMNLSRGMGSWFTPQLYDMRLDSKQYQ